MIHELLNLTEYCVEKCLQYSLAIETVNFVFNTEE